MWCREALREHSPPQAATYRGAEVQLCVGHSELIKRRSLLSSRPEFRREVEESYAGAIAVPPDVPLVITEGNYLLLDQGPWSKVREFLDEAWFLAPNEDLRVARLVERHVRYGKTPEQARNGCGAATNATPRWYPPPAPAPTSSSSAIPPEIQGM
jgi:hypothetical protein